MGEEKDTPILVSDIISQRVGIAKGKFISLIEVEEYSKAFEVIRNHFGLFRPYLIDHLIDIKDQISDEVDPKNEGY